MSYEAQEEMTIWQYNLSSVFEVEVITPKHGVTSCKNHPRNLNSGR